MAAPSQARDFFTRILDAPDPYLFLSELAVSGQDETEWLDMKCARIPGKATPIDENDIRRIWSDAVAGFANTAGGVLIWGIEAKPDADKIDRATALALAPDAEMLAQRLHDFLLGSANPPVQGIDIRHFAPEGKKAGFVVCYVPMSDLRPHRAELAERRFPMRAGRNFVEMPVEHLRTMFHPKVRALPLVEISVTPLHDSVDYRFKLDIHLTNDGNRTAGELLVWLSLAPRISLESYVDANWHFTKGNPHHFVSAKRLHPAVRIELISVPFPRGPWFEDLIVDLRVCGDDIEPMKFRAQFTQNETDHGISVKPKPEFWRLQ